MVPQSWSRREAAIRRWSSCRTMTQTPLEGSPGWTRAREKEQDLELQQHVDEQRRQWQHEPDDQKKEQAHEEREREQD